MTKKTRYFLAGSAAILAVGIGTGLVAYFAGGFQALSASPVANELRYVPADASVVAYADVRAIMDSELRARLKQAMPMKESGQQEFEKETGIDIERDIDYVVAAAAPGSQPTSPLVVARGRFNDGLLETLAREHGGAVEQYKGKRLVSAPPRQNVNPPQSGQTLHTAPHNVVLAFLEPGLVAVGDGVAVKKAIDAQLTAQSITSNNEMMELVRDIESSNNVWAVGRFDVLASQGHLPQQVVSKMPAIKWFAAAGRVDGGIAGSLRAEARDDQSAENLRDVVRGVLAIARMQAQSDPRSAGLVNSLQLSGSGKTVSLSFAVPSEVLQMLPKMAGQ